MSPCTRFFKTGCPPSVAASPFGRSGMGGAGTLLGTEIPVGTKDAPCEASSDGALVADGAAPSLGSAWTLGAPIVPGESERAVAGLSSV